MARIRSIKPDFWTSEQVMECSPIARLLFVGMWNFADDHGRIPCSPKTLKAQIFPADDIDAANVRRMVDELSTNGLVRLYEVDGKEFLLVTGWHHQKIDKRQAAKYPDPPKERSSTVRRTVATDLRGSEGIGEDRTGISPAAAVDDWPKDFGDLFWEAYPKKTEKISAMKKLAIVRKSGIVTFADVMAGVKRYATAVTNSDPKYTKHPTSWLNAGCWADETQPGGGNGTRDFNAKRGSASSDFFAGMRGLAADIAGDDQSSGDADEKIPVGRVNIEH